MAGRDMTTLDRDECARLLAMRDKATPGEWVADDCGGEDGEINRLGTSDGSSHYYHTTATLAVFYDNRKPEHGEPYISEPKRKFNCQFAASAHDLANQLEAALAEIDRLRAVAGGIEKSSAGADRSE